MTYFQMVVTRFILSVMPLELFVFVIFVCKEKYHKNVHLLAYALRVMIELVGDQDDDYGRFR